LAHQLDTPTKESIATDFLALLKPRQRPSILLENCFSNCSCNKIKSEIIATLAVNKITLKTGIQRLKPNVFPS
jgi:hypothetical protein